eukprot:CAMPEP_0205943026 /NCGR_PEP_ID=MMETSP1325-20131115/59271_1 /ASSEMBLY_ACC=CAM_ASM_000708 /TAXON_ID=236786 /ORGANISM="Florenciella sp., Strain RCC1007" /LENGTH=35 /DNA_ID= /DNA_START= /DNA_END= /DNA_ORIENTATION=
MMLSERCSGSGETATINHVAELPPSAFCSKRVSLE